MNHTTEELRAGVARNALRLRRTADEMAAMFGGCDDPLAASTPSTLEEMQALYTDWREFARVVCAPIVESEDEATIQQAMRRFRAASPYGLAASLVMADAALTRLEGSR